MELPKNITQIGEVNPFCKIYVEDYVISYLKQLNQVAINKDMAVALYGERKTEGDIAYLFLYGACKLDFLQRETRHLSQAQKQEIDKLRKRYFAGYEFLGYRLLNGEMIEGFHVCEQDICRYIEGYAQFYTKNDSMLAYMLESREEESAPEIVDSAKYEAVKKKQEARRGQAVEGGNPKEAKSYLEAGKNQEPPQETKKDNEIKLQPGGMRRMRMATVATFLVLCIAGLSNLGGEDGVNGLQEVAGELMAGITEQKIPDASSEADVAVANSTLVAQEKLTEALQEENQEMSSTAGTAQLSETSQTSEGSTGMQSALGDAAVETQQAPVDTIESQQLSTETAATQSTATGEPEPGQSDATSAEPKPEQPDTASAESEPAQQNTTSADTDSTTNSEQNTSQTASQTASQEPVVETAAEPISYTIDEGDTLIRICITQYGNAGRMDEVCELNEIDDPDDIKVGQKILLPQ